MNKVYVLYCESWGGTAYSTQLIEAYADEELARRVAIDFQRGHKTCDVHYMVECLDFNWFCP